MSTTDDEKRGDACGCNAGAGSPSGSTFFGRRYEICIGGRLDSSWSEWFEGLEMHPCGESCTILCGPVADQAALLGILNKICRLNLPLVSVNEVEVPESRDRSTSEGGE